MPPHRDPRPSVEPSFPDIGHEGAEKWINHLEKTFRVMQSQGNLLLDRWVETTTWFLGPEPASWWRQESYQLSPKEVANWEVFKQLFQKRFIPRKYIDRKKQKFTQLNQGKMTANEYYRRFTDWSRYHPEVVANRIEMLRHFRTEDSENMPSESEDEEEKNGNQRRDDKGKESAETPATFYATTSADPASSKLVDLSGTRDDSPNK
ncbi:uncharacterized protein LOC126609316 [Malus sylvestris]|uniref:uncharacterized protein LOC126609316 n=1 Tax=Malus sylvestris TaxID=3752 RepID=UPI0021AC1355|nr:uncharacterized protein LOC126609316 [Malus sylvestris]